MVLQTSTTMAAAREDEDEKVVEVVENTHNRRERAGAAHPVAAAPSYAIIERLPPSLLQSHTVRRAKRPGADVECAVAVHTDAEFAESAVR